MKLRANGNQLEVTEREALTSGSVGVYTAEFAFIDGWEGMLCSAVFRANNQVKVTPLDGHGRCVIPYESLAAPGELLVGAFGIRDQKVVLTTEYASAGRIAQGAERDGDPSLAPEQTAYERILEEVYDLRQDIAEFEYAINASEAERVAAEEARQAAEQARVDENNGTVAKAAAQAGLAAGHARSASASADRAQAEAERATVPAMGSVYNIVLADRNNGARYVLTVDDGALMLLGVRETVAPDLYDIILTDLATGERYALLVEDGEFVLLGMSATMSATDPVYLVDAAGGHVYTLAVEAGELMLGEVS